MSNIQTYISTHKANQISNKQVENDAVNDTDNEPQQIMMVLVEPSSNHKSNTTITTVRSIVPSADRVPPSKSCLSTTKKEKKKRSVMFHQMRQAAEYNDAIPTCQSLTPLPAQDIDVKCDGSDAEESDEEMRVMTKQNNATLAQWDDFEEEDDSISDEWMMSSEESCSVESRLFPNGDDTSVVFSPLASNNASQWEEECIGGRHGSSASRRRRRKSSTSFYSGGNKRSRRSSRGRRESGSFGKSGIGKSLLRFSDEEDEIIGSLKDFPSRKNISEFRDTSDTMESSFSSISSSSCSGKAIDDCINHKKTKKEDQKTAKPYIVNKSDSTEEQNIVLEIYKKPEFEIAKSIPELLLNCQEMEQDDGIQIKSPIETCEVSCAPPSAFLRGLDAIIHVLPRISPVDANNLEDTTSFTSAAEDCFLKQTNLLQQASDMIYGSLSDDNEEYQELDNFDCSRRGIYSYTREQVTIALNVLETEAPFTKIDKSTTFFQDFVQNIINIAESELQELDLTFSSDSFELVHGISKDLDFLFKSQELAGILNKRCIPANKKIICENELFVDAMLSKTYEILKTQSEKGNQKLLLQQLRLIALSISIETKKNQEQVLILQNILGFNAYDLHNDLIKIGIPLYQSEMETVLEWPILGNIDENSNAMVDSPSVYYTGDINGGFEHDLVVFNLFQGLLHRKVFRTSQLYPIWIVQTGQTKTQMNSSPRESIQICCDILNRMNVAVSEVSRMEKLHKCTVSHVQYPVDSIHLTVYMRLKNCIAEVRFIFRANDSRAIYYSTASSVDISIKEKMCYYDDEFLDALSLDMNEVLRSTTLPSLERICSMVFNKIT